MFVYLHVIEAQAIAIVKLFGQGDVKVVDVGETWKEEVIVEYSGDTNTGNIKKTDVFKWLHQPELFNVKIFFSFYVKWSKLVNHLKTR